MASDRGGPPVVDGATPLEEPIARWPADHGRGVVNLGNARFMATLLHGIAALARRGGLGPP
eukprot:11182865-Lingulodinium_polyedra.AAC.1